MPIVKRVGKKDLANFVLSRSTKSLQELIENTWKMESAQAQLTRQKQLRIDIIRKAAVTTCVDGCNGHWYECATEVLQTNSIHPFVFAAALRELMIKGRGKFRNLMLVGPANCGKTFLLSPLQVLFNTFSNPSNDKYAWIGAEQSEIIFVGVRSLLPGKNSSCCLKGKSYTKLHF